MHHHSFIVVNEDPKCVKYVILDVERRHAYRWKDNQLFNDTQVKTSQSKTTKKWAKFPTVHQDKPYKKST